MFLVAARSAGSPPCARLALIAFAFHAPGLYLFARARQNTATTRRNVATVALTLAAMAVTALATHRALAVAAVWLAGHFVWGAWLARRVLAGCALR